MSTPLEYDDLRHELWLLLHYTQELIIKCQESFFRKQVGLSYQQFLVMMTVTSVESAATETEIATRLQRNLNSISMMVDRMVKQGLVTKSKTERDRRLIHVKLTEKGKEKLVLGIKAGGTLLQRLTQSLTLEETQTCTEVLRKLRAQVLRELGREAETDLHKERHRHFVKIVKKALSK